MLNCGKPLNSLFIFSALTGAVFAGEHPKTEKNGSRQPNILFAIADDQSFPYTSSYGAKGLRTPAFDEIARNGVLFTNAFVAAPQSSPSRAAILTGKNIWQLEEAGTHSSYFPKKLVVFTDLLETAGYQIGFTGKPWAPGNWKDAGWERNPVGPEYNNKRFNTVPASGINKTDYFENFKEFFAQKGGEKPFFFWYGGHEPHRDYEEGSGLKAGKNITKAMVPSFLPEVDLVRSDILDYYLEIEWFDSQLAKMVEFLREKGELENTLIIVTADNGMSFPSAKANLYEFGTHVPLAISWPDKMVKGKVTDHLVGLIDLAPTILDLVKVKDKPEMTGKNLSSLLLQNQPKSTESSNAYILTGRERHSHARPDNLGYPARAIRNHQFLFILNLKPDRWPAGDPATEASKSGNEEKLLWPGYHDIDNSPTKLMLIEKSAEYPVPFRQGYEKRPEEELYSILTDPGCTQNLAKDPAYQAVKEKLRQTLESALKAQGDPRMTGKGDIFDSYPRFGAMRDFPGFKEKGKYNPKYQ
jgi:uncharacterized sulfatase